MFFSTDTKATFANSAEKHGLNLFWPPCVMNINEVCMDWFLWDLQTCKPNLWGFTNLENFNGIKWDAINTNLYKKYKDR